MHHHHAITIKYQIITSFIHHHFNLPKTTKITSIKNKNSPHNLSVKIANILGIVINKIK